MRNFVPLILAVSGVFLFHQGHSSHQDSPEISHSRRSGIVVTTPGNVKDDKSAPRSRGGYLTSEYTNQDLDLNSEAIRFKGIINRTRRSSGDIGAIHEVYTNRKRNGTFDCFSPAIIGKHVDDIPSIAALLDRNQKLYLLVHGWFGSMENYSSIASCWPPPRPDKDEELAQIKNELLRVENATVIVVDWSEKSKEYYQAKQNARSMA
ncbi:unnamed protein product [Ixodes pacificus]